MTREDLVNMVEEELKVCSELGYEFRHTAKNIIALIKSEREHLDYDFKSHTYEWDEI